MVAILLNKTTTTSERMNGNNSNKGKTRELTAGKIQGKIQLTNQLTKISRQVSISLNNSLCKFPYSFPNIFPYDNGKRKSNK